MSVFSSLVLAIATADKCWGIIQFPTSVLIVLQFRLFPLLRCVKTTNKHRTHKHLKTAYARSLQYDLPPGLFVFLDTSPFTYVTALPFCSRR